MLKGATNGQERKREASMAPYELAREVGLFVLLVYVGIGVILWRDYRSEK